MKDLIINNVCDYLEVIETIRDTYPTDTIINSPVTTHLLFRGISDSTYPLIPGVLRKDITMIENKTIENEKYTAWVAERYILKDFIAEARGYIKDISSDDYYRWSEYAQHYGVPTRYLDWTSNPLVALYFACKNNETKNSCVWLLHLKNYIRFSGFQKIKKKENRLKYTLGEVINQLIMDEEIIDYPIVYKPYYIDNRMSAQSSFFMVWGNKSDSLDALIPPENYMHYNKQFEPVKVYGKDQEQHVVLKLNINSDRKLPFLRELDMMGINEKTLFPGLDGIGRYLERKYRFDYNEAIMQW